MKKKTPHVHAAVIHAYADGEQVQCWSAINGWCDIAYPDFDPNEKYRIKPAAPETRMTKTDLAAAWCVNVSGTTGALRDIANLAIARALADGDVVLPSDPEYGVWKHNPYTGRPRHPGDIESDPMGVLLVHSFEPMRAA